MSRRRLGATASLALALIACGGAPLASPTASSPVPSSSSPAAIAPSADPTAAPALASAAASAAPTFARGSLAIQTQKGPVSLSVEIADDEAKREYGLMNRTSLPPDAGMLFVFNPPAVATQTGFWMVDTLIPLSVAFVEPNLRIESIQDMQPLTRDIHYAPRDYAYAIEANLGFFATRGAAAGNTVTIKR